MKNLTSLLFTLIVLCISCSKEPSDITARDIATGSIVTDAAGNCMSANAEGSYIKDSTLNHSNFIEIVVNNSSPGIYTITSDTINGYYFSATDTATAAGYRVLNLYATGTPQAKGVNTFTIRYDTSACRVAVEVKETTSVFYVQTLSGSCSNVSLAGNYKMGVAMNTANTASVSVQVTTPGVYTLTTNTVNGVSFTASGVFTAIGVNTVVLHGSGLPVNTGAYTFGFPGTTSTCTFPINFTPNTPGAASYTLATSSGGCSGAVVNGEYVPTRACTDTHTVKINVNVSATGTYAMSTNTVWGVSFSGSGSFTTTGPQTVTLKATGTPGTPITANFTLTAGSSSCTFSVVYPQLSTIILYGTGMYGPCQYAVVNGTYTAGVPLNATNTIQVRIQAGYAGYYNIYMDDVTNGMTFTRFGYAPAGGSYDVLLQGNGTPVAAGVTQVWPRANTTTCSIPVTVN
jgi:hypothetical protein